jgi:hypothetical protein
VYLHEYRRFLCIWSTQIDCYLIAPSRLHLQFHKVHVCLSIYYVDGEGGRRRLDEDTVAPSRIADSTTALAKRTVLRTTLNTVPAMAAPSKEAPLRSTWKNLVVSNEAWLNRVRFISVNQVKRILKNYPLNIPLILLLVHSRPSYHPSPLASHLSLHLSPLINDIRNKMKGYCSLRMRHCNNSSLKSPHFPK